MDFEWDENKNHANISKHGVSFELAKQVFGSPVFTRLDTREDYGELRFMSIGECSNGTILIVVHTRRQGRIRLISARPASRKERDIYYEQIQ